MRRVIFSFLFLAGMISQINAGEIFGAITENGKSVGAGIKLEIALPDTAFNAVTDKFGSYRLFIPQKGKFQLKVYFKEQMPAMEVQILDKAVRHDLLLELKDGQYNLRRK